VARTKRLPPHEKAKRAVLRTLTSSRHAILREARTLPPSKRDEVFLGTWSARHLVAHLIGWDHTNSQAVAEVLRGKVPAFFRRYDHDWASYNASLVRRHNRGSFTNLLAAAANSSDRLLVDLQQIPSSDFFQDRGLRAAGWKVTIARLLEAETKDERRHAAQLRQFLRSRSRRR